MSWNETVLGDILDFFDHKRVPLSSTEREQFQGEYRYFGAQGVIDYVKEFIFDGSYLLVAEDGENLRSRNQPIAFEVDGKFWVNNHAHIIKGKRGVADDKFIQSLLNTISIDAYVTGAAQPKLSQASMKAIKIKIPGILTQQKIAHILSAYDDLIENNLKRIKLLEEMAQITYEEWFVRMKFPGHEQAVIDAETGLPEGWKERSISEFCMKITDGTHDSPKEVDNGVPLITGKHILGGFIDFDSTYLISEEDHQKIKKRSGLACGDILFSNIGTLGNIGVVNYDFEFSCKNVIIFKRKIGFDNFLYAYLANEHTKNKLDAQSAGVAQKFYSLKFIRVLTENLPGDDLLNAFNEKVTPIYKLKYQLHTQNQFLKEARDILLPRLMTGIIDVNTLDLPQAIANIKAEHNGL